MVVTNLDISWLEATPPWSGRKEQIAWIFSFSANLPLQEVRCVFLSTLQFPKSAECVESLIEDL